MNPASTAGVSIVRVVLALAFLSVVLVTGAILVVARELRVADDEGAGTRGDTYLRVRSRALSAGDSGVVVDPFLATDVTSTPDGWVLLDGSSRELLLLSPRGHPEERLGRRGQGPGELEYPRLAVRARDGTVGVADAFTRYIDIFPVEGDPWRWTLDPGDCTVGDPVGLWAESGGGWLLLRSCMTGLTRSLELVRLAVGRPQVITSLGRLPNVVQDVFAQPLAVELDGRLLVGSTRRACFSEVDPLRGQLTDRHRCLPTPAPFETPDSLVQAQMGRSLGHAASVGLRLALPDQVPPLSEVRETSLGPAVRIVLEDLTEVWALEEDGALVYAAVPDDVRVWPGWESWLLVRDELEGLRIWTVPYERWVDGA